MESGATYLFTQGTLGVVVVALATVCIRLYNKIERQQTRIEELQELRLQDSKEVAKDITEVLQGNSQSNRILAEKIESAKTQGRTI
jgi:hypothetical protein